MDLEDLVLRIPKGSPLTPLEMDENLDALRDAINGVSALFGVALNPDGSLKTPYVVYGVSAGGTDAYQITPVPAVASMASLVGRLIILEPRVQNTGPATLEIIGVGAVSLGVFAINKFYNQALESGDIKLDQPVLLNWTGVHYVMQSWPGVIQPINYALDTGAVNEPAVAAAVGSTVSVPAVLVAGYKVAVKIAVLNTGASNLHIGALSAPIRKNFTNVLAGGDLVVGQIAEFIYDGTNFQLMSPVPKTGIALPVQAFPLAPAILSFAHTVLTIPTYVRVVLKCRIDNLGWLVGEEVEFYNLIGYAGPGTEQYKPPVTSTTLTVEVNLLPAFTPALNHRTTGTQTDITKANWDVKVYVAP